MHPLCRMLVLVPAKDEERRIGACLDALIAQRDEDGKPLDPRSFEIRLLVNNSRDHTARIARGRQKRHPHARLVIEERNFAPREANVGFARRHLFEIAARDWRRRGRSGLIATTDADSRVDVGWIAGNARALRVHDLVGGDILIDRVELARATQGERDRIAADRAWRMRLAHYAALLDPDEADLWPHHYHHTGASLAIRSASYVAIGGMPIVAACEDTALVRAAFAANLRIRHEPRVRVHTSPRLHGRARAGMSATLRDWAALGREQLVPSALVVRERLRLRAAVRGACADAGIRPALIQAPRAGFPTALLSEILGARPSFATAWAYCRAWFDELGPDRESTQLRTIGEEIRRLDALIARELHRLAFGGLGTGAHVSGLG